MKYQRRPVLPLLAVMLVLLTSCGSSDTPSATDTSSLVSAIKGPNFNGIESVDKALLAAGADQLTVSSSLGGYDTISNAVSLGAVTVLPSYTIWGLIKTAWNSSGLMLHLFSVDIDEYKITYKADDSAEAKNLTGALFYPNNLFYYPKGILLFTHPTETERRYSPSVFDPWYDGTFTKPFAWLFAALGYAVVVPDYPGLGDNYETHPYCLTSLGKTSAAMVKAVKKINSLGLSDKKVSIIGFSEGGYAALASAYYMRHYPGDYTIDKVMALSGPYDLKGAMKTLMVTADAAFPAPYFLPYVINGYHVAYPGIDYLAFNKAVVATPVVDGRDFNTRLQELLYGAYSGSAISSLMTTVVPAGQQKIYNGPISITSLNFQNELKNNPDSAINTALKENTLARDDWFPDQNVKFFFAHYEGDDCVPYGNTEAITTYWGKYTNVKIMKLTDTKPLTKEDTGTTHAASIVKEYIEGMKFLVGITN